MAEQLRTSYQPQEMRVGSENAWNDFVTGTYSGAFSFARRVGSTLEPEAIEDIVQGAYMKIYERKDRLYEDKQPTHLLWQTLANLAIDEYRRRKRRPTIPLALNTLSEEENFEDGYGWREVFEPTIHRANSTEDDAITHIALEDLLVEIDQLSTDQRESFLYLLAGFTLDEIGERLNLPVSTIKARIFRARKNIKESVGYEQHQEE